MVGQGADLSALAIIADADNRDFGGFDHSYQFLCVDKICSSTSEHITMPLLIYKIMHLVDLN